jgi:hypothetical protein
MRPRCRCQKDTLTLLHYRGNPVFREIYRESEGGRGRLEREVINPARLILMRCFDLILRMGLRVMVFEGVRMHQSDWAAVIVAMMGMKLRRGNQGNNHGHHTQTCAEPLHAADFLAPCVRKSTAHHFSGSAVQTAMQWTLIARFTLILCLLGLAPHSFGQKVTFGAITGMQLKYVGLNQDQFQFVVGIDGSESPEPISAFGHKASLGIVAGLALTGGLQTRSQSFTNALEIDPVTGRLTPVDGIATNNENRSSPVVGIVTEVALPKRLSLEVGALYRPMNAKDTSEFSNGTSREVQFTVLTWEFPILAKYKVPLRKATPFVEVGPSIRTSGNLNGANPSRFGITTGIGMELPARRLTFAPTLRFTRWATDAMSGTMTHANQAELLLGVRF